MTVCIGMISAEPEQPKGIVVIADKMLTYPGGYEGESDAVTKIVQLVPSTWVAAFSGATDVSGEVIRRASGPSATSSADDVTKMMDWLRVSYTDVYESRLEQRALRTWGLDLKAWRDRANVYTAIPESLANCVTESIAQFRNQWACSLLVCGFDKEGQPHIFRVDEDGVELVDSPAFESIGSGGQMATGRLIWEEAAVTEPLHVVLWRVFDAKAHAELMLGVGYEWDAWILVENKEPIKVEERIKTLMDHAFYEVTKSPFPTKKTEPKEVWSKRLGNWKKELEEYVRSAIA